MKTTAANPLLAWMRRLWPLLLAAAMFAPLNASAEIAAVTNRPANMRAGPDRTFPLVAWLPAGAAVDVMGCIDGWRWCDIVAGPNRGWVYARFLSTEYENRPTVILDAGGTLGLPLIAFSVNTYWDSHYRSRPFWKDKSSWARRPATWQRAPSRPSVNRSSTRPTPTPPRNRQPNESRAAHGGKPAAEAKPAHNERPANPAAPSHNAKPAAERPQPNARPSSNERKGAPAEERSPSKGRTPSSEGKGPRDGKSSPRDEKSSPRDEKSQHKDERG